MILSLISIAMEILYYLFLLPLLYLISNHFYRKFQNFPPSPPFSLPIIGHLYLLKKPLHRTLAKISDKYGPVLFLKLGFRPVVLVSSPSVAEECLTKNDIIFANRPRLLPGKHLGYNYTTLNWAPYGHHWRNMRRIAILETLSKNRIQAYTKIRKSEIHLIIDRLLRASGDGEYHTMDMKTAFFEMTMNIMMRMIAGKRYSGNDAEILEGSKKSKDLVINTFPLSWASNFGDFLPFLKWIGVKGIEIQLEKLQQKDVKFMQDLIEERKRIRKIIIDKRRNKTLIDALLSLQETDPEYYKDDIIKGNMSAMLSAGVNTTSGTTEWALSLLLNNPESLKKARNEIDTKIGSSRLMEDNDLPQLPYLHAVITETLRMYPSGPMLGPRESSEECTIAGFRVPRGTMLLINVWAIQNDPKLWEEPTKFKPERFINFEGQRDGFKMMPFGYGRRNCPGENLAMRVIGLALGLLIQCFDWERPSDDLVDMTEGPGLVMPKVQPLMAKYKPRQTMLDLLSQMKS